MERSGAATQPHRSERPDQSMIDPQMKVLILAPFAAAIISSIVWYEDAERNLARA
jgi:hypothetical protein